MPALATPTPQATPAQLATPVPLATPALLATPADVARYRPALLGTGPNSLINRIDTQDLINKGQKDGSVMFCCSVKNTGEIANAWTYRGTPESSLLEEELFRRLGQSVFVPAMYNGEVVHVLFFGTVTFKVVNGKPRLRIFANQEAEELKKEGDFIGPQPFVGRDSKFEGLHYPNDVLEVPISGLVELAMKIDAEGNLNDLRLFPRTRRWLASGGPRPKTSAWRDSFRPFATENRLSVVSRFPFITRRRTARPLCFRPCCRAETKKTDPAFILFPAGSARLRARARGRRAGLGNMLGHRRRDRGLSHFE